MAENYRASELNYSLIHLYSSFSNSTCEYVYDSLSTEFFLSKLSIGMEKLKTKITL